MEKIALEKAKVSVTALYSQLGVGVTLALCLPLHDLPDSKFDGFTQKQ